MFGFSDTFSTYSYEVLNYGIFSNNGVLSIREGGNTPSLPLFDKYTVDDVFSVERIGNTIAYLKNEVTFYVSCINSTEDMHFCFTSADRGASVTDVLQHNYYPAAEGSSAPTFDQSLGCEITKDILCIVRKTNINRFGYCFNAFLGGNFIKNNDQPLFCHIFNRISNANNDAVIRYFSGIGLKTNFINFFDIKVSQFWVYCIEDNMQIIIYLTSNRQILTFFK
jgi:hypothetical protein